MGRIGDWKIRDLPRAATHAVTGQQKRLAPILIDLNEPSSEEMEQQSGAERGQIKPSNLNVNRQPPPIGLNLNLPPPADEDGNTVNNESVQLQTNMPPPHQQSQQLKQKPIQVYSRTIVRSRSKYIKEKMVPISS